MDIEELKQRLRDGISSFDDDEFAADMIEKLQAENAELRSIERTLMVKFESSQETNAELRRQLEADKFFANAPDHRDERIAELQAEIERLSQKAAIPSQSIIEDQSRLMASEIARQNATIAELRRELEEARKDADKWRSHQRKINDSIPQDMTAAEMESRSRLSGY